MTPTGYSGTPLAKKLGLKEGFMVRLINQPEHYFDLLTGMPQGVTFLKDTTTKKNLIHYFEKQAGELYKSIPLLKKEIEPDGIIWISWPKKAAKLPTDISEDIIREIALSNGLVDVKVCAVDEVWSGLKLVIPVKARGARKGER